MANIGTFTAQNDSFTGTVRTLTLNVKVKFIPNAKESENAPDYRIVAGNFEIGAAWKKISKAERPYLSATLDLSPREIPGVGCVDAGDPARRLSAPCGPRTIP